MEKNEIENNNILIELDSFLDTRLPIVYAISPEEASKISKDGSYVNRKRDNFGNIPYSIFQPMYRNRKKKVLALATITPSLSLAIQHYGEVVTEIKHENLIRPTVFVNVYPYALDVNEQNNLRFMLNKLIPNCTSIEFVSMNNLELTPKWIKENVRVMIKYDGLEWIDTQISTTNLITCPLLDVFLFSPAIVKGNVGREKVNIELFKDIMAAGNTVINLNLIDAEYFSAILNKK